MKTVVQSGSSSTFDVKSPHFEAIVSIEGADLYEYGTVLLQLRLCIRPPAIILVFVAPFLSYLSVQCVSARLPAAILQLRQNSLLE
jgi:hypothetical protein